MSEKTAAAESEDSLILCVSVSPCLRGEWCLLTKSQQNLVSVENSVKGSKKRKSPHLPQNADDINLKTVAGLPPPIC